MGSDYETLYEIETEAGAVFRNVLSLPLPSSTVLSPAFTAALLAQGQKSRCTPTRTTTTKAAVAVGETVILTTSPVLSHGVPSNDSLADG